MSTTQAETAAKGRTRPAHTPGKTGTARGGRSRRSPLRVLAPYLMIAPTIVGLGFLLFYPVVQNVIMSFQHFRLRELILGGQTWVGFDNYKSILNDSEFWSVTKRTFVFTGISVGAIMLISTVVALMLNRLGKTLRIMVLSALILSWATPIIAGTTVFQWLFQSQRGVVNWILVQLGFTSYQGHSWLADGNSALTIVILCVVWQSVPFATLTIYAGLTTIPEELYESARMDGAGGWRIFRSITFPVMRPIFALVMSLEIIWVFKSFGQIYAITKGGPNGATTTLPVYAYQVAMSLDKFDVAGAVSMLTILMIVLMLLFYFRQMFKQEGEQR